MKVEVRYYSRSGNTKLLAESIANGANTKAVSVDSNNSINRIVKIYLNRVNF